MNYKNVIFDFGNVIGKFDGRYILEQFCSSREDYELLFPIVYADWAELDKGTIDYDEYIEKTVSLAPKRLENTVRSFFRGWPEHVHPIQETLNLISELHQKNVPTYLLSNAPVYFAEWAVRYTFLEHFHGLVFSGPLKMAKPDPGIYQYLFETFSLDPKECFFIDDLEKNIAAGKALGMDGIVFTGNTDKVKAALNL